jgi:hypothetical protein
MKLKTFSEMISAGTIGASFGLWVHQCNVQVQGQRTETQIYIQSKPEKSDTVHRSPNPEILPILYWAVLALIAFAVFKVLAAAIYGVLTSIFSKSKAVHF